MPTRYITYYGLEVGAVPDAVAIPPDCRICLPSKDAEGLMIIYDKRSLEMESPPPPLPKAPPAPLPAPPATNAPFAAHLERAAVLVVRARERTSAIQLSVRQQEGMLLALAAALSSLREASAHGAGVSDTALRQRWSAVTRAVAEERDARDGLPAEASSLEGARALATAAEEVCASQEARQQATHTLAAQREGVAGGVTGAHGRDEDVQPLDQQQRWTPLSALEEGEQQLTRLHERAVLSQSALLLHCHARLKRVAQLQRHMVELYRGSTEASTPGGATPTGASPAAGADAIPNTQRPPASAAAAANAAAADGLMTEDLGEGVLVPRMEAREVAGSAVAHELREQCGCLHLGGYLICECVGSGSFAHVYRVERRAGTVAGPGGLRSPVAALKAIERRNLSPKSAALLTSEVRVLHAISHPNIVRLHHVAASSRHVFLWMDYCDTDLAALIRSRPKGAAPDEIEAAWLLSQLVDGLSYMRARRLLHRDIKPQNLLLAFVDGSRDARRARLLIGDFGLVRALEPSQMARTVCGSPLYMAPEVLRRRPYNAAAEVWSVGICMHELLAGTTPFYGATVPQLLDAIGATRGAPPPPPPAVSPECADLLARLLQPQPEQRPPIEHLLTHPFLCGRTPGGGGQAGAPARRRVQRQLSPAPVPPPLPSQQRQQEHKEQEQEEEPLQRAQGELSAGVGESWEPLRTRDLLSPVTAGRSSLLLDWALADGSGVDLSALKNAADALVAIRALVSEIRGLEEEREADGRGRAGGHAGEGSDAATSSRSMARQRLRSALLQVTRMLPRPSASDADGGSVRHDESDEETSPAAFVPHVSAIATATSHGTLQLGDDQIDAREQALPTTPSQLRGVPQLFHRKADECRELRKRLKQLGAGQRAEPGKPSAPSSALVSTGSFKFNDRVMFVRRTSALNANRVATASATGDDDSAVPPSYVAVREESDGGAPYFLSRASESSALGRRLPCGAAMPQVLLGRVVHIEHGLRANSGQATALGIEAGAEYHLITAEMGTTLAPEVMALS